MSAVIYAAIVVMWAVVLVPMWLRRHDAATESRSVDRFSTAMRTLSRRTPGTPGRRYVVMPRRTQDGPSVHVSGAAVADVAPRRTAMVDRAKRTVASRTAGRPSIVARRRRFLLGLLALTFFTMLLAMVGVISWPLQIVVDVVLVAFCIHLRAQARRAAAVARQRRRAAVAAQLPMPAATRPPMPAAGPSRSPLATPVARPEPVTEPIERVVETTATGTDDMAFEDATWEPVPVPRPTYTMKPPAPAYEADPTYAPPVYEPARAAVEAPEETVEGDSDLDEILERRWAVND